LKYARNIASSGFSGGGTVAVEDGTGVLVGGRAVTVGVTVGGTGVEVGGILVGVAVGGTGVKVG
jgi:hypothetical protein